MHPPFANSTNKQHTHLPTYLPTQHAAHLFSHRQRSLFRSVSTTRPPIDASNRRIQPASKLCTNPPSPSFPRDSAPRPLSCSLLPTLVPFRSPLPLHRHAAEAGRTSEEQTQRERDRDGERRSGAGNAHAHCTLQGLASRPVPRACRWKGRRGVGWG
jgi:hypothetical protein